MGNKLMRKMVAVFIAAAMVLTSGIGVFAASSSEVGKAGNVNSYGTYGSKTFKVWFNAAKGAKSYTVTLKGSDGKTLTQSGTGTSYTFKVKDNVKYDITVTAISQNGKGKASTSPVKMTASKRWMKNTKITKVTKGKKKATVKWKKVKGATGYQIAYSKDGKTWKYQYVKGGKKTKATVKKLTGGKKYYFKVRPVKNNYLGVLSGQKSCKVKK